MANIQATTIQSETEMGEATSCYQGPRCGAWCRHRGVTDRGFQRMPKVNRKGLQWSSRKLWISAYFWCSLKTVWNLLHWWIEWVLSLGEWKIAIVVISVFILSDWKWHLEVILKDKRGLNLRHIQYFDQGFMWWYCKPWTHPTFFSSPLCYYTFIRDEDWMVKLDVF